MPAAFSISEKSILRARGGSSFDRFVIGDGFEYSPRTRR